MEPTIQRTPIEEYLADIHRRLAKLETGGKPMVGTTATGVQSVTVGAGQDWRFVAGTWWGTNTVTVPMGAVPYMTIYVDQNAVTHRWHQGSSLSAGQRNFTFTWMLDEYQLNAAPYQAWIVGRLVNNDTVSHTYFIHTRFTKILGGTSST